MAESRLASRCPRPFACAFLALGLALLIPSEPASSESRSGIEGRTLIAPTRPRVDLNHPEDGTQPFPTTLLVLDAADKHEVARFNTSEDGRFRISLPPGDYILKAEAKAGLRSPKVEEHRVRVSRGKFSKVTLTFDSGMR